MAEINWTPARPGTVPIDVTRNPEQAKAEAMFDREKLMHLGAPAVIEILLDRIERLERSVFPLD
jgi:hypothetical protein